jgi:lycopene beta-cyclase
MAARDASLQVLLGCHVTKVATDHVALGDRRIAATIVMDNRGARDDFDGQCGYQKFVGQELECAAPHGVVRPILMDATVDQRLGYRFFYVLPLSPTRLLLEDTYYSDHSVLDVATVRNEIAAYASNHHWTVASIEREETGILPLPWAAAGPDVTLADNPSAVMCGGYRGGWFHPVTGYSFPLAWRLAVALASAPLPTWRTTAAAQARRVAAQQQLALRMNWMLFQWFKPPQRHHVLARFYRLSQATIERFYALDTTVVDRLRLFVGRPPRGMSWRAFWSGAL